jgi:hypothetical protein
MSQVAQKTGFAPRLGPDQARVTYPFCIGLRCLHILVSQQRFERVMTSLRAILIALLVASAVAPANAQSNPPPPPSPPPRPPAVIISPNEIYRGPPLPPDRPDPAPRPAISPPMERAPQMPPMSPRIGN